jgi:hypothetical protein
LVQFSTVKARDRALLLHQTINMYDGLWEVRKSRFPILAHALPAVVGEEDDREGQQQLQQEKKEAAAQEKEKKM